MTYKELGGIKTLEHNGLEVSIDYSDFNKKIEEEMKNSYIYNEGEQQGNLYYFGKKGLTKDDYISSLLKIKELIDKIFTDIPSINIFDFIIYTKKGMFAKNKNIILAIPIAGLFINQEWYKCIECFAVKVIIDSESKASVHFIVSHFDEKKIEPVFFSDYENPTEKKEKLKAIKKADLKPGMIYSDEKHNKFFLYLGYAKYMTSYIKKTSKTCLSVSDFAEEDMEEEIKNIFLKQEKSHAKHNQKYNPYKYLYINLTKKEYETLRKITYYSSDFEDFITDCMNKRLYQIDSYDNPLRVFHEEHQYLTNIKYFKKILKKEINFLDNTKGLYAYYPKDTFTFCGFTYINYN